MVVQPGRAIGLLRRAASRRIPTRAARRGIEVTDSARPPAMSSAKVMGYCSRWDFLLERCKDRTVLHLGCVGETDGCAEAKLNAFSAKRSLHPRLLEVTKAVVGVDIDANAVELIRNAFHVDDLFIGDVEKLEALDLHATFDVVLCGDLLEHLSSPGRALAGIRRFMSPASQLIISVPNAFALLGNLRFSLGFYREPAQHVATYSKFQLVTLLMRHGFKATELYTCYDRPPISRMERWQFSIGIPFFKALPERGGTLLAVANTIDAEVVPT